MGTSYDIRCIDCNENADLSASFDPIRLWLVRPIIDAAEVLAQLAPMNGDFTMERLGVRIPFEWFAKHRGHRLRPVTEYGDVDGQCGKRIKCAACGVERGTCNRDVGHEGDCARVV